MIDRKMPGMREISCYDLTLSDKNRQRETQKKTIRNVMCNSTPPNVVKKRAN
jgi:hypothetical protein